MGGSQLPAPVVRRGATVDAKSLEAALRDRVDGEVRFDDGSRAAYSTDASHFRQTPIGVVVPHTPEAAVRAVAVAREHDAPVLSRGGGTSLAGQCTNTAVVIDWSKYGNRLESVDTEARTCVVQPGIVLAELNRQLAPSGLRFGPEPATHANCTIGGMIGNNSCGATAQAYGKVVDGVARLKVLLYDGTRFWCGRTSDEEYAEIERQGDLRAAVYRQLRALRDTHADEIRRRYPDIPRRVSGYNLDSLLPEHGFDVAGLLVGSESTLGTVLRAELKLVPVVKERALVVLGFPGIDRAADAVPEILPYEPIALEGLDSYLLHDEQLKHLNPKARAQLPERQAYLMVQFGSDTVEEADERAHRMLDALHESEHDPEVAFLDDPAHQEELWQVREAGLGATAHVPDRPDTFEGREDSAVPPERLGDYLRRLRGLFEEFGYQSDTGPRRYRTRSTCAWPARGARRTARPMSTWPPTRLSSCPTTTRAVGGAGRAHICPWAGCPSSPRPSAAPGSGRSSTPSPTRRRCRGRPSRSRASRTGRCRCSPTGHCSSGSRGTSRTAPAPAAASCSGRTPSPTTSTRMSAGRPCRCWSTRAGASNCPTNRCAAG